jgi:drug/metabolite transporter (DMT)-like permease
LSDDVREGADYQRQAIMLWVIIGLLAPACWACGNHIDAYLLRSGRDGRGVGSLMICSALIGLPALVIILASDPGVLQIRPIHGAILVANGVLYVLGLLPYLYALQREEASVVVPLFQMTAVFSYLLGLVVLDEQLTWWQLGAALLVMVGAALISFELTQPRPSLKLPVLALMLLASFLNSLNWLLFKLVAVEESFWRSSFWEYVGFTLVGCCLLLVRPYREELRVALGAGGGTFLGLVTVNESLSVAAKTFTNMASLLAPLALVSVLHGLQPLFVFIYGALLTIYLPTYGERLGGQVVLQRLTAIALVILGTSLLALG